MTELRYSRNIGTVTEEEMAILQSKKVFLAGCGGLGGNILSHLLRIGIGSVTAIDGDVFDETNLNRQLLSSTEVIGQSKAVTAAVFGKQVNPSVKLNTQHLFLTEENCPSLIAGHDMVIDALDNIESRRTLSAGCDKLGIPMLYGAIRGWTAQIGVFPPGKAFQRICTLYPKETALTDKSCLSFTPALCASIQVSEAVKYLLGKENCLLDRLLYIDLSEYDFEEIPFFD